MWAHPDSCSEHALQFRPLLLPLVRFPPLPPLRPLITYAPVNLDLRAPLSLLPTVLAESCTVPYSGENVTPADAAAAAAVLSGSLETDPLDDAFNENASLNMYSTVCGFYISDGKLTELIFLTLMTWSSMVIYKLFRYRIKWKLTPMDSFLQSLKVGCVNSRPCGPRAKWASLDLRSSRGLAGGAEIQTVGVWGRKIICNS